jgi:hypothetical protein
VELDAISLCWRWNRKENERGRGRLRFGGVRETRFPWWWSFRILKIER